MPGHRQNSGQLALVARLILADSIPAQNGVKLQATIGKEAGDGNNRNQGFHFKSESRTASIFETPLATSL
jgi:hypothetical protein